MGKVCCVREMVRHGDRRRALRRVRGEARKQRTHITQALYLDTICVRHYGEQIYTGTTMHTPMKNVPLPSSVASRTGGGRARKYPLDTMEVGEMFFVPNRTKNNLTTHASAVGRKLKRKFATRLTYMKPTGDENAPWTLCDADDPDATLGIGVWRKS